MIPLSPSELAAVRTVPAGEEFLAIDLLLEHGAELADVLLLYAPLPHFVEGVGQGLLTAWLKHTEPGEVHSSRPMPRDEGIIRSFRWQKVETVHRAYPARAVEPPAFLRQHPPDGIDVAAAPHWKHIGYGLSPIMVAQCLCGERQAVNVFPGDARRQRRPWTDIKLTCHRWQLAYLPGTDRRDRVTHTYWLGQCPHCRTIYWASEVTPEAEAYAIRSQKRRTLALFPEVCLPREYQGDDLQRHDDMEDVTDPFGTTVLDVMYLGNSYLLLDGRRIDLHPERPCNCRVDEKRQEWVVTQPIPAPDWIPPEAGTGGIGTLGRAINEATDMIDETWQRRTTYEQLQRMGLPMSSRELSERLGISRPETP